MGSNGILLQLFAQNFEHISIYYLDPLLGSDEVRGSNGILLFGQKFEHISIFYLDPLLGSDEVRGSNGILC
jgi:hypothetical protein